jgi:hypothetical protein
LRERGERRWRRAEIGERDTEDVAVATNPSDGAPIAKFSKNAKLSKLASELFPVTANAAAWGPALCVNTHAEKFARGESVTSNADA